GDEHGPPAREQEREDTSDKRETPRDPAHRKGARVLKDHGPSAGWEHEHESWSRVLDPQSALGPVGADETGIPLWVDRLLEQHGRSVRLDLAALRIDEAPARSGLRTIRRVPQEGEDITSLRGICLRLCVIKEIAADDRECSLAARH